MEKRSKILVPAPGTLLGKGARSGLPRRVTWGTRVHDELAALLVDQRFKTHRHPDGREYTYQEVVATLKTLGISIDYIL